MSNQGRPHRDGWFTKKNLRRLWNALRRGEAPGMTCHPTHPREGFDFLDADPKTHECAGLLLIVQRELHMVQTLQRKLGDKVAFETYLTQRRQGLTRTGLLWWAVSRCALAGTIMGGPPMDVIEEDADVGYPGVLS
jgi:hypothetical protein